MNFIYVRFILLFIFLVGLGQAGHATPIEARVLVAVVNLKYPVKKGIRNSIYTAEDLAVLNILGHMAEGYSDAVVLFEEAATVENFMQTFQNYANKDTVKAIDAVFYVHGGIKHGPSLGLLNGKGSFPSSAHLAGQLKSIANNKLRALYSDACYGSFQNNDWLDAGFKIVAGSRDQDINHAVDFRRFVKKWREGKTYKESLEFANNVFYSKIMDRFLTGNSDKIMAGDPTITIDSPLSLSEPE